MTATLETVAFDEPVTAQPANFVRDLGSIAGRALRAVPRDLSVVIPPVLIALFFFIVNIATLQRLTRAVPGGLNYRAFEMATAVLLGVTGVSRAGAIVLDVQDKYLDRLLLTPVRRSAILLGHMTADVVVSIALTIPIMGLGLLLGVRFNAGPVGVLAFMVLAAMWSLAFAGFGYAIALKTGNPAAVNSSFLLFFPFLFLTSSYVPRSQLSGWLHGVSAFNPVTYILDGLRSLVLGHSWSWGHLAQAAVAIGIVGAISMTMCFAALRGRVRQAA
jgi:ABC-2 type transport system permease protein